MDKEIKGKPLTIEELKTLTEGEWVWVELQDKFTLKCNDVIYDYKCSNKNLYFQVASACDIADKLTLLTPYEDYSLFLSYSDYGKRWLAYKNKEEAENAGYGDVKQAVKEFAEEANSLIHEYLDNENDYTPSMVCRRIFNELLKERFGDD